MVLPFGNAQQDEPAPDAVKERYSPLWWVLMGLLGVVCIGRIISTDISGGLLSGVMAFVAWYMVSNNCANLSQYCVSTFGFMCLMNAVLELVTLAGCVSGRSISSTESKPMADASTTSYTVTVVSHPFFDPTEGWMYNTQSAMMIASPLVGFLGALLAYFCYNSFPTSLFSGNTGAGADGQGFGGGFGGSAYNNQMTGASGGGGGAFQNGRSSTQQMLWGGSGQRLGS